MSELVIEWGVMVECVCCDIGGGDDIGEKGATARRLLVAGLLVAGCLLTLYTVVMSFGLLFPFGLLDL